jgi:hypothetical protein
MRHDSTRHGDERLKRAERSTANALQPKLKDGLHLRWAFRHERGFPWYGYCLFRRIHSPQDRPKRQVDLLNLQSRDGICAPMAASHWWFSSQRRSGHLPRAGHETGNRVSRGKSSAPDHGGRVHDKEPGPYCCWASGSRRRNCQAHTQRTGAAAETNNSN